MSHLFNCSNKHICDTAKHTNVKPPVNRFNNLFVVSMLMGGLMLVTGCSDRVSVANNAMKDIRESNAQPVDPPPTPELVEDYVYDAMNVRSPFMPPSLLNLQDKIENTEGVAPDLTREKQPLESYELAELTYKGLMITPEGQEFGLIQRPDGVVMMVQLGDYMGSNDGRIVEITPNQINLIEIVPDTRAGFVEKPASIVTPL